MARAVESQNPGFFRTLAATNAAENILVSTVHGGPIAKIDGTAWLHGAGAVLAIVGGNMAILVGTAIARAASLGLAVLGLLSFMTLVIDSKSAGIRVLPDGAWERGSVYSIIVGQMFTAAYRLRRTHRPSLAHAMKFGPLARRLGGGQRGMVGPAPRRGSRRR